VEIHTQNTDTSSYILDTSDDMSDRITNLPAPDFTPYRLITHSYTMSQNDTKNTDTSNYILDTSNAILQSLEFLPYETLSIPLKDVFDIERMYPPIRNVSSENHLIENEEYGNGHYVTSFSSSHGTTIKPCYCFNTSRTVGGHWAINRYSSSTRFLNTNLNYPNLNDNIVNGYYGDWLKIKLPVAINLTRYAFLKRSSSLPRAPGEFRIYGSNDETYWEEITTGINPIYVDGLYETTISTPNLYNSYGLVVNRLNGTGHTVLNFDEWFIYGEEIIQVPNEGY